MALRVPNLDAAVEFHRQVLGLVETERVSGVSYLTCNERHHELILIEDPARRGYDHIALEVSDGAVLEGMLPQIASAGGEVLGTVYDGEPGIDRAVRVLAPGGHVFKLFCGMELGSPPAPGDRPVKFEHASVKVRNAPRFERFLQDAFGLRFSDRMGPLASWWHCDSDHHGIAVTLAPRSELHHYAFTLPDLNSMGRVADRLKLHRDQRLMWGPSRHGPGNNQFMYFHDNDGAMIELCSEIASMEGYVPRSWPIGPKTLNLWGGPPPLRFLLTGFPVLSPEPGCPSYAVKRGATATPASARATRAQIR